MRRYQCTVSYVGALYEGWQSQGRGTSVQEVIEEVLHRITQEDIKIMGSGRTDAGVNAGGQVFSFYTEREMTCRKWMGAINGYLPKDIHIMKVEEAPRFFHVRYNVRYKQYDYRIDMNDYNVFAKDYAYQIPLVLDTDAMRKAIPYLIGTHDFTSYNSSPLKEFPDQVRTVFDIKMTVEGSRITLSFIGKGFLRYMVRMMAGTLVEVGRHKIEPEDVKRILEEKSKTAHRKCAPANGLTLEYVDYFEVPALSEEAEVREFLFDDELPEGMNIKEIEESVKKNLFPRFYVLVKRHEMKRLGHFIADRNGSSLVIYNKAYQQTAEELIPALSDWCKEKGINEQVTIISQE